MNIYCPFCGVTLDVPDGMNEKQHVQCVCGKKFCLDEATVVECEITTSKEETTDNWNFVVGTIRKRFYEPVVEEELKILARRRFFARVLDYSLGILFALLVGVALCFLGIALGVGDATLQFITNPIVDFIFTTLLAHFFDVIPYSVFGNTPGKKLLGLRVCDSRGRKMLIFDYIKRDARVLFYGLGMCLPIVTIITLLNQRASIVSTGVASYDTQWSKEEYQTRAVRENLPTEWLRCFVALAVWSIVKAIVESL